MNIVRQCEFAPPLGVGDEYLLAMRSIANAVMTPVISSAPAGPEPSGNSVSGRPDRPAVPLAKRALRRAATGCCGRGIGYPPGGDLRGRAHGNLDSRAGQDTLTLLSEPADRFGQP
jgi:hypothetical protein